MSMGYGTEDEEERKLWTGIRAGNGNAIGVPIGGSNGRSPGSEKGKMEVEVRRSHSNDSIFSIASFTYAPWHD
ncbi:hypothetical protein MNV49_001349 [Pseudohyphozyma bogoriensis]|nr:hypothetical protein MNV49_001349 [Pseudohyphozyma bogoriensis]